MSLASLGQNGLLGREKRLSLVLRNAECMPGLSLGLMFMEVSDLGATEQGQKLMKVLLLAQLEVKPRLVGCGFSFPCWLESGSGLYSISASGINAIRMRTEIQRLHTKRDECWLSSV